MKTTTTVKIISIWSKIDGLEGRLSHRDHNVEYEVEVPTGSTRAETLEAAYDLTNRDDRPMGNQACSTTAGDIMVLDGQHVLVAPAGFTAITEAQSKAIQALTSSDTSLGMDWLVKRCNIPTN